MARFAFGMVGIDGASAAPCIRVGDKVALLRDVAEGALAEADSIMGLLGDWDATVDAASPIASRLAAGERPEALRAASAVRIHAPLQPRQVFCTGANYHRHVVEIICDRFAERKMQEEGLTREQVRDWAEAMMTRRAREGEPYIFSRTAASYAGPFDDLVLAPYASEPDWEAELAAVFRTEGHAVSRDDAMSLVAGYMVVNDVTNRDQIFTADPADMGADWLHAKNSPGYFPMGPWLTPACFVENPHALRITLKLNGETMQDELTDDMIFDIPRQIETLTKYTRVYPGDVLATGSPSGNGTHYGRFLRPGDVMEASVEGLGTQIVRCVSAQSREQAPAGSVPETIVP